MNTLKLEMNFLNNIFGRRMYGGYPYPPTYGYSYPPAAPAVAPYQAQYAYPSMGYGFNPLDVNRDGRVDFMGNELFKN